MERHAAFDAGCQFPSGGGGIRITLEDVLLSLGQLPSGDLPHVLGELHRQGFGGSAGVDEHQALTSVLHRLLHKCPDGVAGFRDLPGRTIVEHDGVVLEHTLLQRDRTPVAPDQVGVEPFRQVICVGYGGGQRYDLQVPVPAHELRQRDLQGRTPSRVVDHVDLIGDDQSHILYPFAPVTDHGVRLLGCGHHDVGIL